MQVFNLFSGVSANATQSAIGIDTGNVPGRAPRVYQATMTTTSGSGTATVTFFGSNDGTNYSPTPFGTITLSGTSPQTDNFASSAPYQYVRCTTASVTGTGVQVNGSCGV